MSAAKLPKPAIEIGPKTEVKPDRKGITLGRSIRRDAEDNPSADYLKELSTLGLREGESNLAFVKRMAATRAGREFAIETWKANSGSKARAATAFGTPKKTLTYELRVIGLSVELLDKMLAGKIKIDE